MTDLERAVRRVTAFVEKFTGVENDALDLIDEYDTGETLLLSDLRLLTQAVISADVLDTGVEIGIDQLAAMEEDAEADEINAEQLAEDELAVLDCDETADCEAGLHTVACRKARGWA